MHGEIGSPVQQRFFDFLREQPLAADLRQRHVGYLITGRFDDLDAALAAFLRQLLLDPTGLPQSELRTARRDNQHSYSRKWKTFLINATAWAPSGLAAWTRSSEIGPCAILLMIPRVAACSASSCSGVNGPYFRRTLSNSAARTCSSCSCRPTMVGVISTTFRRAIMR